MCRLLRFTTEHKSTEKEEIKRKTGCYGSYMVEKIKRHEPNLQLEFIPR